MTLMTVGVNSSQLHSQLPVDEACGLCVAWVAAGWACPPLLAAPAVLLGLSKPQLAVDSGESSSGPHTHSTWILG